MTDDGPVGAEPERPPVDDGQVHGHLVSDEMGGILYADRNATLFLGVAPRYVRGKPLAAFVTPAARRQFRRELLALVRDRGTRAFVVGLEPRGAPARAVELTASIEAGGQRPPGSVRWKLRTGGIEGRRQAADELPEAPGRALAAVQLAAARHELLVRVSTPLAEYDAAAEALVRLARACVPVLADWASVDLLEDGTARQVGAIGRSGPMTIPERRRGAAERALPEEAAGRHSPVPSWLAMRLGRTAEQRALLRSLDPSTAFVLRLDGGGRCIGTLALVRAFTRPQLSAQDERLLRELADRTVLIAENARLAAERNEVARGLQRSLQSPALPTVPGLELAARMQPAYHGGVAGDFYDAWPLRAGVTALAIGDVAGKGLDAAVVAALVRHALRAAAVSDASPAAMLRVAHETLQQEFPQPERFCTAVAAVVEHGAGGRLALRLARAGHPYPLIASPAGPPRLLQAAGPPLGVSTTPRFEEQRATLVAGETLLLYTDGVLDVGRGRRRFGLRRLLAVAAASGGHGASELIDLVERRIASFGETARDDVTLLAMHAPPVEV